MVTRRKQSCKKEQKKKKSTNTGRLDADRRLGRIRGIKLNYAETFTALFPNFTGGG
jgi:hypothetical protein